MFLRVLRLVEARDVLEYVLELLDLWFDLLEFLEFALNGLFLET